VAKWRNGKIYPFKFGSFSFSPYICKRKLSETIMSTKAMIQLIADYFKTQPVLKAWIFGSFSRGEQTADSDIDILVVLDESQHVGMKFFGMYEDLKALLGRNVDLVTDRSLASFARESVDRDKILIYERTTF
jgi:predicted nucleotidyltransferase